MVNLIIHIAIYVLVAVIVLSLIAKTFVIISQSETMIIERLGKYKKTLHSGINAKIPVIDKPRTILWRTSSSLEGDNLITPTAVVKRIDLREQVYDYPRQNVITRDNVNISIDALLYFQITDPKKAVYEVADFPNAIEKLTQTTLRNVIGELELDETLSSRDTINSKLTKLLDEATDKWGVKVNRVELKDIDPPKEIRETMEKQMRAERDKRAAILTAEGDKQSKILEAEGFKASEISKAEGEKAAAILKAEGEAQAKIAKAKAEAESIDLIKKAFDSPKVAANYLATMRYIETLGTMVDGKNNKVVYMPYEATGVLSSLGGIKDMLNQQN
ncbi:MAG: SPFH/Band 7/PHB domain protein [Sphaerochaetaceae bacterium]|mgnify:CR=1 FL=1|nr:SPFH/Band 7/PHB domain protein [Sphaerochaetaceae bacterium]